MLLAAASFLLVFPLVDGRTLGWPAWIFGVLAAAVPLLGLFVAQQRYRVRAGRTPLVEFSVLRKRSYVSGVVFVLVFFASIVGFSLTMGLFLQIGLGFTPIHASLLLAAMAAGAFIGSGVGAWAATAVGRPILHIGLTIMAAGTLVLYLSLHAVRATVGTLQPDPRPGRVRDRHGHDLRAAVQHHHGRDRRPRGRLGVRPARVVAAARRLARRGRPGHAVLQHALAGGRRPARGDGGGPAACWRPSARC